MDRAEFLYKDFLKHFGCVPTSCQDGFFRKVAAFVTGCDADILVVNGYAGTGKTTAISAVINSLAGMHTKSVLLAPTGRAAKVLSGISGRSAYTVHKQIYRQKSVGADGYGQFSLAPNKLKDALIVVDEVSLIGIDADQGRSSALFGTGNLLEDLITYVRSGADCRLVMIGDAAQLPPVGLDASPALSPEYMNQFGGVEWCELTTVVRQASDSGILANATMLRGLITGACGSEAFTDLRFRIGGSEVERISGGDLIESITDAYGRYGEDGVAILCRSNKRAVRYNAGIRSRVQFKEGDLERGDRLMIVRNCYQFVEDVEGLDYIANGDIAVLRSIRHFEERYGLHFATATLAFPDYDGVELSAKLCLDTLSSESASLSYEQSDALYQGVSADYADRGSKKKIWEAVREDPYFNALQIKYASAITCHKSQGGQWDCIFIDCPFWQDEQTLDDLKWMYTALTRAVKKVYLVNFPDRFFDK